MNALACIAIALVAAAGSPRVILDTDFRSDADDAGALATLNALADNGECEIIGVVASQTGPHVVAAINAVNTWYGRGEVPVGLSPVDDQRFPDYYAPTIGDPERFPSTQTNAAAPDSTTLYRRLLHDSPDASVRIVVIGGQTCPALLLDSPPDHEGDGAIGRSGHELIERKVAGLYIMGGNFQDADHPEHNINLDREAAERIAAEWPTPIIYSGFEIGRPVITGGALTDPERNPVAMAYKMYPAGGVGAIGGSSSYDQTIVHHAVRGGTANGVPLWRLSPPGDVTFPESRTRFEPWPEPGWLQRLCARLWRGCAETPPARRHLIAQAPPETLAEVIEALMIQPPAAQE